jgi:hypothetical protein
VASFFPCGDHSLTAPTAPSLRALVPSDSLIRFQSIHHHHHHPKFLFSNGGDKTIPSGRCSHISGSYSVSDLFFRFGGGRPLHNVQSLILRNPLEVSTICFAIFTLKISYKVFLSVPPLPRCDRCPELHPPMLFAVVPSFLRYSGRLPPRSFIPLLPSWRVRYIFLSVRTLRAPRPTRSFVRFFLTTFLLRRAAPARTVIPLPAAANYFRDPQFPRVHPFGSPRHPAARCRPLCRFVSAPGDFTAASSLGAFWPSASDSMSSEVGSLDSRRASVVS